MGTVGSPLPGNPYFPGPGPGGYPGEEALDQDAVQHAGFQQRSLGNSTGLHQARLESAAAPSSALNLALRTVTLLMAATAVAIIASGKYKYYATDILTGVVVRGSVTPIDVRPYRFLVAASAVVIAYTLVQIVLGLMARSQSKSWAASSFRSALITFAFDQVFGYLMMAAATSGATYADLFRHYGDGTQCESVGHLCTQVEAGVAMSYIAFGSLAICALLSALTFARHIVS